MCSMAIFHEINALFDIYVYKWKILDLTMAQKGKINFTATS